MKPSSRSTAYPSELKEAVQDNRDILAREANRIKAPGRTENKQVQFLPALLSVESILRRQEKHTRIGDGQRLRSTAVKIHVGRQPAFV